MIEDKRLIDNIINEFIIYKNKFNNNHMDDRQLFSVIMYKNIRPKDYAELQKDNGNIIKILKNKKTKMKNIIQEINNKKEELLNEKENVKKEKIKTVKELKYALVASIYDFNNYIGYEREFRFDNESVSINNFVNTNIDIDKITNSNISFKIKNASYINLDEKDVFKLFGNKSIFVNRLKIIENGCETKLEELQSEIDELDSKKININKIKIQQLINEYGEDGLFDEYTKSIEKFLITKGYITEDYKDYITFFIPGNLTREDNAYVFAVKTGEKLPYDYELNNISNILKKLNEGDFETICILNFDLLEYLVKNNFTDKVKKIINLLDQMNDDTLQFIDDFIDKKKPSKEFINLLIENSTKLWKKIYKKIGNKEYIDKWVINFLLNEKSLENIDENFVEYINNHKDIDKYVIDNQTEIIINALKNLGVKLSNIEKISNPKFLEQIYENGLYKLNTNMIKNFLNMNTIDCKQFEEKNLTTVMENDNKLKEDILNKFEEYYDLCYSLNKSCNDEESVIIDILSNTNIDLDIKKKIIINEEFDKYDIKGLDEDLIETIINEDKLKPTYNNILEVITKTGKLELNLINHICNHIKDYAKQNINDFNSTYDIETIDLFINEFIFNKDVKLETFKILTKSFNKKISEIEDIEAIKLEYLIENEIVEFNTKNFDYIKNNLTNKLLEYIINNIEDFIQHINEYDILNIKDELLTSKKIDKENKVKILDYIGDNDLENDTILHLILTDNIIILDRSVNETILADELIPFRKKIDVVKILLKNIENKEQGESYIHFLKHGYEDINTSKNTCNINSNNIDIELCNLLKEKGYISSYKKGKKNNILLFNKVNRK